VLDLLPLEDQESLRECWRSLQAGTSTVNSTYLRRTDGSALPATLRCGAVISPSGYKEYITLVRDTTSAQRDERTREVLSSLGKRLSAITTLREAGLIIINAADDLFSWDAAFISLFDARTRQLMYIGSFDEVDGTRTEFKLPPAGVTPGSNAEIALTKGSHIILRPERPEEHSAGLMFGDQKRHSASLMFVPIRRETEAMGLISVQSYRHEAYDQQDLELLESLADYCSGAFERILVQEQLREAEQRFSTVFEHAPIGFGLLRPDGDWLRVNRSLCQLVGYSEKELLATGLHGITAYEDLSRALDALLSVFSGADNSVTFEARLIHRSSRHVWVNFQASLVRDRAGEPLYLIAQIQDVTRQHRLEQIHSELRNLGQQLIEAATPAQVAHMVLTSAERLFGWDAGFVELIQADTGLVRAVALIDTIDGKKQDIQLPDYAVPEGSLGQKALNLGAQLILRDSQEIAETGHIFGNPRPCASLIYVPVRREGKNVGVLSIQSYEPNAYTVEDMNTLQELADYCSTAFERAYAHAKAEEAEQALRESQQRFEVVMRATNDVIYDWNIATGELWWNDNIELMFGFPLVGDTQNIEFWTSHIHPDDYAA
jgi:PAS domain S-box-containing protein